MNASELLKNTKAGIHEISPEDTQALLDAKADVALLDVREADEVAGGHLPGAVHIPRGFLELRIEDAVGDRGRPIVVYCAGGVRSAYAAATLTQLGYTNVKSMEGGFSRWKQKGFAFTITKALTPEQRSRYSRHILLPEVGEKGQQKLLNSRVLMLGAGGLGSPSAYYLAAAGVGTLGIIDDDVVDASNLQRQILHNTDRVGMPKIESARETLTKLNPDVKVIGYQERLTSANINRILDDKWDIILDGLDNFQTRYLVNDAAVWRGLPVVHGSIFRFEGQVTTLWPGHGPCYRCLYPEPPPAGMAPSCSEAGVLGVLPGIVGTLEAIEVVKFLLGKGDLLTGRLLIYDALKTKFRELKVRRDEGCAVCGTNPTITDLIDYEAFCSIA
jgi:molybdopterin/thiamine biosynthesis adenylyltransferase/rhodanese-related sulfurtransferase